MFKTWGVLLSAMAAMASPIVVESLDETPSGWEEVNSPAPDKIIDFSIGLEYEDHQILERTLHEVSDPSHASYGKHLSREAAKALLNPSRGATESVKRWLSSAGVPEHHVRDDGQWIHVRTTVDQAEGLLSTRFGVYARDDEHVVRTRQYSVPHEIRDHITTIQPTTFFNTRRLPRKTKREALVKRGKGQDHYGSGGGSVDLNQCRDEVTPACLRKLYKMPAKDYPKAHKKSLYGIVGFNGQYAQYDQLEEFLDRFAPDLQGTNFSVALVNGGKNLQGNDYFSGEANLDIQYAVALAHQIPVRYISVGGEEKNFIPDLDKPKEESIEPFLELTTYLLNLPDKDLPQVISISYGVNEQHVPKTYARQVCNMFGQLGARGVSVVVASGDFGPGASCRSNDGKKKTKFLPGFPSGCPYVTSVGGTEKNRPEVAWSTTFPKNDTDNTPEATYTPGGGFSEHWPRPRWQDQAVKGYLKKYGNEWKGYFNPDGRAYPDVAALATGYQIMNHNVQETTGGTSASSPVFGAMVALINNERLKKGKPPMGFLNPWIYKYGDTAFTDITQGKSAGCPGFSYTFQPSPEVPNAGWRTAKGWDPVTGWGTPLHIAVCNAQLSWLCMPNHIVDVKASEIKSVLTLHPIPMHLINVSTLGLEEFYKDIPEYAILSHTWGDAQDEVTFKELSNTQALDDLSHKKGFGKIKLCAARAQEDGLQYCWVDTCCIDKSSSAELSEAINSMFAWYRRSAVCYVYLQDVLVLEPPERTNYVLLMSSRWFERGWTLQELIAPRKRYFFDVNWSFIGGISTNTGRKARGFFQSSQNPMNWKEWVLLRAVADISGVPQEVLETGQLDSFSTATKMSWAARRRTTRTEDEAYCLMGIFDVNMPLLYGEGGEKAFIRLQEEIIKKDVDHSIFAWYTEPGAQTPTFSGLLSPSPKNFLRKTYQRLLSGAPELPYEMTNKGLHLQLRLIDAATDPNEFAAILDIEDRSYRRQKTYESIHLRRLDKDQFARVDTDKYFGRVNVPDIEKHSPRHVYVKQLIDIKLPIPCYKLLSRIDLNCDPSYASFDLLRISDSRRWDHNNFVFSLLKGDHFHVRALLRTRNIDGGNPTNRLVAWKIEKDNVLGVTSHLALLSDQDEMNSTALNWRSQISFLLDGPESKEGPVALKLSPEIFYKVERGELVGDVIIFAYGIDRKTSVHIMT
ncbi:hypothetical protein FZEAL_5763 [Fusarium zealandicum]|uniref:tripeptidyl-peptidase II n=1 Tax=Fusarium zealandicum TaxID=1053134 RepID=A0A8H4UJY8_9HYPO|nr:hypothetical protein FZEAL_5763 [Fusarium zealandicum]